MQLRIGFAIVNTMEMQSFKTNNPAEPVIYMDQNRRVFVGGEKGVQVRRALTPEITVFIERYGIAELASSLRHTPADVPKRFGGDCTSR